MIVHGVHDFTARDDRTAAVKIEATADALDALRVAVKGCGVKLSNMVCCGGVGVTHRVYCRDCTGVIDRAISRLISETGEGNG
jgi:hypothetical protein